MQIVIELSEENVEKIKNVNSDFMFLDLYEIMKRSINNGIALPAGHGKLIDADRLLLIHEYDITNWGKPFGVSIDSIKNAQTLVPADKEK